MARIGLNNFRYSTLTEASDGTPSYNGAVQPAKAISCTVTPSNNSASLYADDALAESDTSFANASVSITIDKADLQTMATLLGHTYAAGTGMTRSSSDTAPYVGLGRVVTMMNNNAISYRAEILYKVKFAEPTAEENTKGDTVEFGTTTLEGTASTLANGDWSIAKDFDDKDDAIAFLTSTFAVSGS